MVQAKIARSDSGTGLTRSDNGTGKDWHGVTLVQAKTARSDDGTGEDWYWVTMVQAKTERSGNGTGEDWHGVTMVQAKTGTKRKLELEGQSEVRYKHYVNQWANRITVIPNAIFAVILLTFRLYCTHCSGGGHTFCSMHLTQRDHSTHSSGYRSRLNFHVQ